MMRTKKSLVANRNFHDLSQYRAVLKLPRRYFTQGKRVYKSENLNLGDVQGHPMTHKIISNPLSDILGLCSVHSERFGANISMVYGCFCRSKRGFNGIP